MPNHDDNAFDFEWLLPDDDDWQDHSEGQRTTPVVQRKRRRSEADMLHTGMIVVAIGYPILISGLLWLLIALKP